MAIQTNFPAIKPTLLLDFANTEQLDPRITFTRASTATYYGTQTAKAEENLFVSSSNLASASWITAATGTAVAVTKTANYAAAPDGTTTASRYEMNLNGGTSSTDICNVLQAYTTGFATELTYSVWIKSTDGISTYTAQIISPTSGGVAVSITGTWTRFVVTATSLATAVGYGLRLRGGQSPTNSNTADILVWGAQLEQRSTVTAYTPTTTQAITNYIPQLLTAASGVARFDHNPTTFESLGLEIEESRTNLLTYSEDFTNAVYTGDGASFLGNTNIAPDGALTADTLVENTATSNHRAFRSVTQSVGGDYTASIYVKANGRTKFRMFEGFSVGGFVVFDLVAVTATTTAPAKNGTITSVGNGWFRCSVTWTFLASTNTILYYQLLDAAGNQSYAGNGYSGVFLWGAQLEAGAFATSYIPTVASQVTRAADAASMTGTNFSSWYNAGQGTLYADYLLSDPNNHSVAEIGSGASDYMRMRYTSGAGAQYNVLVGGVAQASQTPTGFSTSNTQYRRAITYATNSFNQAINGLLPTAEDTSGTVPVSTRLFIGAEGATGATSFLGGTIKKLAYYPLRVTNAQLQALTS